MKKQKNAEESERKAKPIHRQKLYKAPSEALFFNKSKFLSFLRLKKKPNRTYI